MELTKQVIPYVENYAKQIDFTIHFLAIVPIPDYTYFASYGLSYASVVLDGRVKET
jgi:universal stress protein F